MTAHRPQLLAVFHVSFVISFALLTSASSGNPGVLIEHVFEQDLALQACSERPHQACQTAFGTLFQAAELMYQQQSAQLALRVISLCRRLFGRNLEIQLLLAQMSCRYGDLQEAMQRFSAAEAAGNAICHRSHCAHKQDGVFELLAAGKTAFGMCMMEARKFHTAAAKFRSALALDATLDAVAWHLGLACDYGRDWQGAVEAYQLWLRIHRNRNNDVVIPPRPAGKLVIAIFCLARVESMPHGWGPSSLPQTGIGGSEEAVILLSWELSVLGFHVEVYAHPPDSERGADERGVVWLPVYAFDPKTHPPHVFVSWRGYSLATYGGGSALNFLWLHDRVIEQLLAPAMLAELDGILVLSNHHSSQLPPEAKGKAIATRNGLEPSFFRDGANRNTEFIFASHPERGLEQLLVAWPRIFASVAGATLKVYHGFPAAYGEAGAPASELRRMRAFKQRVVDLLAQPGVEFRGMVNQTDLAHAYAAAGFWLYPTSMAETSCISAMKAMANGAFPITSRFSPSGPLPPPSAAAATSGLTETTGEYDLGPPTPPAGHTMASSPDHLQRWTTAVIEAVAMPGLAQRRVEMKAWARQQYSWRRVAEEWGQLFRERLPKQAAMPVAASGSG